MIAENITHIIFDWGDTLMKDFPEKKGPMASWDTVEVIEGVFPVLQFASSHFTLAVATNAGISDTELLKKALNRGGIEQYFSFFFTSKELGYSKPDIRFFHEICNKMKTTPAQCIFVGNDYLKDIKGAKSSGMTTLFYNTTSLNDDVPFADFIISYFQQIIEILQQ
jgi:putative hydrolase of the HAD superfamily